MPAWLLPASLGVIGGGMLASGLGAAFGKKPKLPSVDIAGIRSMGEYGVQRAEQTGEAMRKAIAEQLSQYMAGLEPIKEAYRQQSELASRRYLEELEPQTSRLYRQQLDTLRQSILGVLPETQAQIREAAAAGGGLGRGVARQALAQAPVTLAGQVGIGARDLASQMLSSRIQAMQEVYRQNLQRIANLAGIDLDALSLQLQYGTQAEREKAQGILNALQQMVSSVTAGYTAQAGVAPSIYSAQVAQAEAPWRAIGSVLGGLGQLGLGYAAMQNRQTSQIPYETLLQLTR